MSGSMECFGQGRDVIRFTICKGHFEFYLEKRLQRGSGRIRETYEEAPAPVQAAVQVGRKAGF